MRLLRLASATVLLGGMLALGGVSCGQSYGPWGEGGCDTFCNRWVGAHCRNPVSRDECMTKCITTRDLCPAHQTALVRCANLEGNIICDSDSGATKIANCTNQQTQVDSCSTCATFCKRWVATGCTHALDYGECLSTCLDPRCAPSHASAAVSCARLTCDESGHPISADRFGSCEFALQQAQACVSVVGGSTPFAWLPERSAPDTGVDTGPDTFVPPFDAGTFPQGGGL